MPRDFYATSAQVLPVILLAMLWESRFLEGLARGTRRSRRQDPEHGVLFWTRIRVRIYALFVASVIMFDTTLCLFVLAETVPDVPIVRAAVAAGLILAVVTLLTRIWIDVIKATARDETR